MALRQNTIALAGLLFFQVCAVAFFAGCGQDEKPPQRIEPSSPNAVQILSNLDAKSPDVAVNRAIADAKQIVESRPDSANAWGSLGMVLLAHDFFDAAAECFAVAERFDGHEARWPYFHSIAIRHRSDDLANEKLRVAIERFGPDRIEPRLRLAEALLDSHQLDQVKRILDEVLERQPSNRPAAIASAQLHLLGNDPQACLAAIEKLQRTEKPDRKLLLIAAEANRRLGKLDLAEQQSAARRVAEVTHADPVFQEVLRLRVGLKNQLAHADSLFVRNQVEESIRVLRQVVSDYPKSEWAHILLARGLIRQRQLEGAKESLEKAISLNPNSFQANFRMGVLWKIRGDFRRASEWFEKTVAIRPDGAVAYTNLGQCQFALGDLAGARKSFQQAVKVQPQYLDGHLTLVEFYARRRDFPSAYASLEAARQLQPRSPRVVNAAKLLKRVEQRER